MKIVNAKLKFGRQEDSHEFLRCYIDSFQNACLKSISNKNKDLKNQENTIIHKIFGGKLKSVVECLSCHYKSETFEVFYDLSLV